MAASSAWIRMRGDCSRASSISTHDEAAENMSDTMSIGSWASMALPEFSQFRAGRRNRRGKAQWKGFWTPKREAQDTSASATARPAEVAMDSVETVLGESELVTSTG